MIKKTQSANKPKSATKHASKKIIKKEVKKPIKPSVNKKSIYEIDLESINQKRLSAAKKIGLAIKSKGKLKKIIKKAVNPSPKTNKQSPNLEIFFGGQKTQINNKDLQAVLTGAADRSKIIIDNRNNATKFAKTMFSYSHPIQVLIRAVPLVTTFKSDVTESVVIITCLTVNTLYTETVKFENLDQALSYVDEYSQHALEKFCTRALAKK